MSCSQIFVGLLAVILLGNQVQGRVLDHRSIRDVDEVGVSEHNDDAAGHEAAGDWIVDVVVTNTHEGSSDHGDQATHGINENVAVEGGSDDHDDDAHQRHRGYGKHKGHVHHHDHHGSHEDHEGHGRHSPHGLHHDGHQCDHGNHHGDHGNHHGQHEHHEDHGNHHHSHEENNSSAED